MTVSDDKGEKAQEKGMEHVHTMTREVWVSRAPEDNRETLPDVTWATLGGVRHKVQLIMQGRGVICHKCSERGHMRRSCVWCFVCRTHEHDIISCNKSRRPRDAGVDRSAERVVCKIDCVSQKVRSGEAGGPASAGPSGMNVRPSKVIMKVPAGRGAGSQQESASPAVGRQ